MGLINIDPCDLRDEAQDLGRGCDAVPNLRSIVQDITEYLCNLNVDNCGEVTVVPCGTPSTDFNNSFNGDCQFRFTVVNCEGVVGNDSEFWVSNDTGVTWTQITFGTPTGVQQNVQHFNAVNIGNVTNTNPGPLSLFATLNVPVVAGRQYQVVFNYRYTIVTFGAVVNPLDTAYFQVSTSTQGTFDFPSAGSPSFFYRDGADQTWTYNWTAPATGTETFDWRSAHGGNGAGWSWDRRIVWWEYRELF